MDVNEGVLGLEDAAAPTIPGKPVWRGRLHQIAFFVTLPAGWFLLAAAHSTKARVAVAVYWATLAGQFAASFSYHRLAHTVRTTKWLRRLDHSMIFMLIAGTYTPLCVLVLPRVWGIPMLVAAWVTALAGIIMKMIRVGATGNRTGSWMYAVLGWAAVISLPEMLTHLDPIRITLLAAGGILYTVGAICLGKQRPNPNPKIFGYHEVWHAFTLAAGACHFALIAMVLR